MNPTKTQLRHRNSVPLVLTFFSGMMLGFAFAVWFTVSQMEAMNKEWQWRVEQEQDSHLQTAKELQELRSSIAAGLNVNF